MRLLILVLLLSSCGSESEPIDKPSYKKELDSFILNKLAFDKKTSNIIITK